MSDLRLGIWARAFPLLWFCLALLLAFGAVRLLGEHQAIRWVETWPIQLALLGCWSTLVVKAFDLKGGSALADADREVYDRSVRLLRLQIWSLFFFTFAAWMIASFLVRVDVVPPYRSALTIVALYLFFVSAGNLVLWPSLWHRINSAKEFIEGREHAEANRRKLLDAMDRAANEEYKPIDHYKSYAETDPRP